MHAALTGLVLLLHLCVALYVAMIGNRRFATRLYKAHLVALAFWLAGEYLVRLSPPGSAAFSIGLRVLLYPGQVAAFLLLARFAREYPERRPAHPYATRTLLVTGLLFALYPYLVKPSLDGLPAGPWGFPLPADLDRAAYGATGAALRAAFLIGLLASALFDFARSLRGAASAAARTPLFYLTFAAAGPLAVGAATDLALPAILGRPVYPLLSAGALLAALAFSAALTRHEMLEIRLVVRDSLVYSFLTALVSAAYLTAAEVGRFVFCLVIPASTFVASYVFLILALLVVSPLRNRAQRFLDRTLFRGRTDAATLLRELFALLATVDDRARLAPQALAALRRHLKLESAALILPGEEPPVILSGGDEKYRTAPVGLGPDSPLLAWFEARPDAAPLPVNPCLAKGDPALLAALDEAARLPWIRASAVLPLRADRLAGLLVLGDREDRAALSAADLVPVAAVAAELARALARLRAFEAGGKRIASGQRAHADERLLFALREERRALDRLRQAFSKNANRASLEALLDEEEKRVEASIRRVEKSK